MRKYYCDKCSREIGTEESYVYEVGSKKYELCKRCSSELSKWINAQTQEMLIKNFDKWVRE